MPRKARPSFSQRIAIASAGRSLVTKMRPSFAARSKRTSSLGLLGIKVDGALDVPAPLLERPRQVVVDAGVGEDRETPGH